jgi:hypothetical protein
MKEMEHVSIDKLEEWLRGKGPSKIEYCRGPSMSLYTARVSTYPTSNQVEARRVGNVVWKAYQRGKCHIFQVRHGHQDFGYVAIRA